MAIAKTTTAQDAGIAADPKTQGNVTPEADHDRVVMASRRPDGSPAQSDNFEFIGDKDTAISAAKTQLSEQAVSAADVAIRGVTTAGAGGSGEPDPAVAEIQKAHESAAKKAESRAESDVNANHGGLGD